MHVFRFLLCVCVLAAVGRAQSGTVLANVAPPATVVPSAATDTTPPYLTGISGGGAAELGATVQLKVGYYGTPVDWTYQWRKNGAPMSGASTDTFSIAAATPGDAGTYSVLVTNAAGESVASTELSIKPAAAPVVTSAPRGTVAQVGQTVTFTVGATGSYPRTYQWRKDGAPIAGATQSALTLTAISTADAAAYSVVISNAYGAATSTSAFLTVNAATPIVIYPSTPSDVSAVQGQLARLSVSISSGSSPFSYQWRKGGTAIPGATGSYLDLSPVRLEDAGKYSVVITNPAGSITSREATLTVSPATPLTVSSQPQSLSVYVGELVSLNVYFNGSSPIQYQWLKNDVPIPGATGSYFSISAAKLEDAGVYTIKGTNIVSTATSKPFTLTVKPPEVPVITTQPQDVSVVEEQTASFSVSATGTAPLSYQWYFNGTPVTDGPYSGYSLKAKLASAGTYHVVVSNAAGSVTSKGAVLTVLPLPPPPVMSPGNPNVSIGGSFTLGDRYSSYSSGTYQWYHNGEAIAGATSSSYTVESATVADAGDYFVVITNSGGATTSRTGTVTIIAPATPPVGAWKTAVRQGDLVYFVFPNPARIERYNLATATWLAPIPLSRSPAAFVATENALYLGSGSILYRYALDGSGETVFSSAFGSDIVGLTLDGDYIIAATGGYSSARVYVLRASDGAKISSAEFTYYWSSFMAVAPTIGKIFSRSTGVSPSDITYATITNGILSSSSSDSPYHGDFPDASRVFVSPNEQYVVDDSGTIYHTADLTFAGSLKGRLQDLAFTANNEPVVLRSGTLVAFSNAFVETGRAPVGDGARVFLRGTTAFVFSYPPAAGSIGVTQVALSAFAAPPTAAPLDPAGLAFTPDTTFVGRDGVVYLFSRLHGQIFRWSTSTRAFLSSLPLRGWPNYVTYSSSLHRIYLGYNDGQIRQIKLDQAATLEEPFASAPVQILGLATAGEYVFLVDPSGAWCAYYLLNADGKITDRREWSEISAEFTWNPVLQRMYHFRDGSSPNDLLYTAITSTGSFGVQKDSPFHGGLTTQYPIRISPDGGTVLLGSGKMFDATALTVTNSLPTAISDATWVKGKLITSRSVATGTQLERWGGGNYALDADLSISGRVVHLAPLADGRLLAVGVRGTAVFFSIFDGGLGLLSTDSAVPAPQLANLAARGWTGTGEQSLIPSFVISGSKPKQVLIRAAGPALKAFGIVNVLQDPTLNVYSGSTVIAANDNWEQASNLSALTAAAQKVSAFPFASGGTDAAVFLTLDPGSYTIIATGKNGGTGVVLVEVYDIDNPGGPSRIFNMATRGEVGTGENVLTPGIVISGNDRKAILLRAVGPGLSKLGIANPAKDPKLLLYRGTQVIYENDSWEQSAGATPAQIAEAARKSWAFPLDPGSKDAALIVTLPPGSYTAQVVSSDGSGGVALVEVYELSN